MLGDQLCHGTVTIEPVTDSILSVPNLGRRVAESFSVLRIDYDPAFQDLEIKRHGKILIMTVGAKRLRKVSAAFAQVEVGGGDFEIATSDRGKAEPWMFWWMPDIKYQHRNRS